MKLFPCNKKTENDAKEGTKTETKVDSTADYSRSADLSFGAGFPLSKRGSIVAEALMTLATITTDTTTTTTTETIGTGKTDTKTAKAQTKEAATTYSFYTGYQFDIAKDTSPRTDNVVFFPKASVGAGLFYDATVVGDKAAVSQYGVGLTAGATLARVNIDERLSTELSAKAALKIPTAGDPSLEASQRLSINYRLMGNKKPDSNVNPTSKPKSTLDLGLNMGTTQQTGPSTIFPEQTGWKTGANASASLSLRF